LSEVTVAVLLYADCDYMLFWTEVACWQQ